MDGTNWEIFHTVFPEYIFASQEQMFDVFKQLGMNTYKTSPFNGGVCYGISLTSVLESENSSFLSSKYPEFTAQI